MRVLTGRVTGGLGDLSGWMSRYEAAYREAVGGPLYPGSLNVLLDHPWVMERPDVRLAARVVGVDLGLVRCRLDDLSCWILRTDKNNQGAGDHPRNLIEVVSPVQLRIALHLSDGDRVSIAIAE